MAAPVDFCTLARYYFNVILIARMGENMLRIFKMKDKKRHYKEIDEALSEIEKIREKVKQSQKDVEEDIERGSRITKHRFTL